jgi:riboflavin-specific deaminase-like protein
MPKAKISSLPFVFINMAMTADGKIATANREVSSFGSSNDKDQLLLLRSQADALMAGARTVDLNPINMGPGSKRYQDLRRKRGLAEYNLRIIVSGSGSINPNAEVFKHRFSPIIILTSGRISKSNLSDLQDVADEVKICGEREIDFRATLLWLRQRWNIKRLLCEGGGELNRALFQANLVDELNLTICPLIFGGRNAPSIADGDGSETLSQATQLKLKSRKRIGDELYLVYRVDCSGPFRKSDMTPNQI